MCEWQKAWSVLALRSRPARPWRGRRRLRAALEVRGTATTGLHSTYCSDRRSDSETFWCSLFLRGLSTQRDRRTSKTLHTARRSHLYELFTLTLRLFTVTQWGRPVRCQCLSEGLARERRARATKRAAVTATLQANQARPNAQIIMRRRHTSRPALHHAGAEKCSRHRHRGQQSDH